MEYKKSCNFFLFLFHLFFKKFRLFCRWKMLYDIIIFFPTEQKVHYIRAHDNGFFPTTIVDREEEKMSFCCLHRPEQKALCLFPSFNKTLFSLDVPTTKLYFFSYFFEKSTTMATTKIITYRTNKKHKIFFSELIKNIPCNYGWFFFCLLACSVWSCLCLCNYFRREKSVPPVMCLCWVPGWFYWASFTQVFLSVFFSSSAFRIRLNVWWYKNVISWFRFHPRS